MLRNIGWALLIWGGIGIVNQVLLVQALNSGQAPSLPLVGSIDPAAVLKIANPAGAGFTSPGMLTNVAIAGAGWWLAKKPALV